MAHLFPCESALTSYIDISVEVRFEVGIGCCPSPSCLKVHLLSAGGAARDGMCFCVTEKKRAGRVSMCECVSARMNECVSGFSDLSVERLHVCLL